MESPKPAAESAVNETDEQNKPTDKPPFTLKVKAQVQYGAKRGRIDTIRGAGADPYEVRISWAGEKYPQWLQYSTLRTLYEQGQFEIL